MPDFSSDIKHIDLRRSQWDAKKSNPKKADYKFTQIVYLTSKDYHVEASCPDWVYTWCRYNPTDNFRGLYTWQIRYKAVPVTVDDEVIPEGIPPNPEGKFVFDDLIMVKIPLEEHMKRRARDVAKSESKAGEMLKAYVSDLKAQGMDAPEDQLRASLEKLGI